MGYTHYFGANKNFTTEQWEKLVEKTNKILSYCAEKGIKLAADSDIPDEPPELSDVVIAFNGVDEEGHESFIIYKEGKQYGFHFCKTACKPYDLACCLVLLAAQDVAPDALDTGSDGNWNYDWLEARRGYKELFGTEPVLKFADEDAE